MAILHWLSAGPRAASVAEISTELDIPKATAYRIINDLKEWDVVEYDAQTRLYALGPRLLEFSAAYSKSTSLTEIARPHLTRLRDKTGETVSLNILLKHERICAYEARSVHGLHWSVPPGARGPLYAGSTGKAILAYMHPEKLVELQETLELEPLTPTTPTDWDRILSELEEVRTFGYCSTIGEVTPGVAGLAVPILDENGYSIGAINLSAPLVRWDDDTLQEYIPLIRDAAVAISNEYRGA
jgi:DNA-binding IclR family transcriptional regulator